MSTRKVYDPAVGGGRELSDDMLRAFEQLELDEDTGVLSSPAFSGAFVPATIMVGTGIDPTGAVVSTTAMQAKLDATPQGGICFLPPGYYKAAALTIPEGVRLVGAGWWWLRDNLIGFGHASYGTLSNFGGSVIISTATTGNAITCETSATGQAGSIDEVLIVGPGSGTSKGVQLGGVQAVTEVTWRHVGIVNFSHGCTITQVMDSEFDSLNIMGCTTGIHLGASTNINQFNRLNIQKCTTTGLTFDSASVANVLVAPTFQSNLGTACALHGVQNQLVGPYFENPTITFALDVEGIGHEIIAPTFATVDDECRFQASSNRCGISRNVQRTSAPITNAGVGNTFNGDIATLTDTGSSSVYLDPYNGVYWLAKGAFSVNGSGAISKLAGVTVPVTVTGSRGGNAALASLLGQLASIGLVTDSTTA